MDETWTTFHHDPDPRRRRDARERLIVSYLPLVEYVAWRVAARSPQVERDDLVSYGTFGLMDAVDRFDPSRGVDFKHFAITRIHGSIIDELRALDWAPRSVRFRTRLLQSAVEAFEFQHQRSPTTQELAARLEWTPGEVATVRRQAHDSQMQSLGDEVSLDDDHGADNKSYHRADVTVDDPVLNVEIEIFRRLLAQAVTRLPTRERAVLTMYWRGGVCPRCQGINYPDKECCQRCESRGSVAGLTLGEIASVLSISQSWACELYSTATSMVLSNLALLRSRVGKENVTAR